MTVNLRTKMFEEYRVAVKVPGAAPGTWLVKSATTPVDEAINYWLADTGNELVGCGPPGIHVQWLDKEMTTRAVIVAVMVTYIEGPRERTVTVPASSSYSATREPATTAATEYSEPVDGDGAASRLGATGADHSTFDHSLPGPRRS